VDSSAIVVPGPPLDLTIVTTSVGFAEQAFSELGARGPSPGVGAGPEVVLQAPAAAPPRLASRRPFADSSALPTSRRQGRPRARDRGAVGNSGDGVRGLSAPLRAQATPRPPRWLWPSGGGAAAARPLPTVDAARCDPPLSQNLGTTFERAASRISSSGRQAGTLGELKRWAATTRSVLRAPPRAGAGSTPSASSLRRSQDVARQHAGQVDRRAAGLEIPRSRPPDHRFAATVWESIAGADVKVSISATSRARCPPP
jgi:hypothetical protein